MPDKAAYISTGGQYTCTVVANTTTNSLANSSASVASTGQGRLCKVYVQNNTVNSITIYDNSTGPGGPILWASPINTAVALYDLQLPYYNGLWLSSATNQPGISFSFALSGAGGVAP